MARESFLMYGAWEEPVMQLSNESKGMLLVAVLKYHNTGQIIELPPDARMAFMFMKKQMDLDAAKYDKTCAARAAAGRIGGLQSKSKQKKQMFEPTSKKSKSEQSRANQADNENEKENEINNTSVVVGATTTSKMSTDEIRKKLSHKFYVSGRGDAECRAALIAARTFTGETIVRMANGEPADITLDGKAIWEFDREMDVAVGYRVWLERILAKREKEQGGNK